jgi:hypothetical protein
MGRGQLRHLVEREPQVLAALSQERAEHLPEIAGRGRRRVCPFLSDTASASPRIARLLHQDQCKALRCRSAFIANLQEILDDR